MNLANYTSGVPANRTIADIEAILADAEAVSVNKLYGHDRTIASLSFAVPLNGHLVNIQLPAKVDKVYQVLRAEVRRPREGTDQRILEQAERTAWRIMWEWVRVQMSLVKLKQADLIQIFLPYVIN